MEQFGNYTTPTREKASRCSISNYDKRLRKTGLIQFSSVLNTKIVSVLIYVFFEIKVSDYLLGNP